MDDSIFTDYFQSVSPALIDHMLAGKRALRRQIAALEAVREAISESYAALHSVVRDRESELNHFESGLHHMWSLHENALETTQSQLEQLKASIKEAISRAQSFKKKYKNSVEKARKTARSQEKRLKLAAAELGISVSAIVSGSTRTTPNFKRILRDIQLESQSDLTQLCRLDHDRLTLSISLGRLLLDIGRKLSNVWLTIAPTNITYDDSDPTMLQQHWAQANGTVGLALLNHQRNNLERVSHGVKKVGKKSLHVGAAASRKTSRAIRRQMDKHGGGDGEEGGTIDNRPEFTTRISSSSTTEKSKKQRAHHSRSNSKNGSNGDLNSLSIDELLGSVANEPEYRAPPEQPQRAVRTHKRRSSSKSHPQVWDSERLAEDTRVEPIEDNANEPIEDDAVYTRPLFAEFDESSDANLGSVSPGATPEVESYDIEQLLRRADKALGNS